MVAWSELDRALASADIVVTATGATEPIISRQRVAEAMRGRRGRPLFIIDIAMPRDVDPAAGTIEQVFLYNIDDLQSIVSDNLTRRSSEILRAETIVNEEVDAFMTWARSRSAMPTVVALRQRFETIRQAELVRLQPRLARRDHAAHRREAADHADRAAQGPRRSRAAAGLCRRAQPPLRAWTRRARSGWDRRRRRWP